MPDPRNPDTSRDTVVVLCSNGEREGEVLRQPLARWQAEALARVLTGTSDRAYWIEELSSVPAEGRVRRRRARRADH